MEEVALPRKNILIGLSRAGYIYSHTLPMQTILSSIKGDHECKEE